MDNVTLNIILALLFSLGVLFLLYLGIMLIVVPYWDKKDEKEKEKENVQFKKESPAKSARRNGEK